MAPRGASQNPKWTPAPDSLVRSFATLIGSVPEAETRKMFGYPAAFHGGHMFAGLFQDTMILRLAPTERAAFLEQKGARLFEPMPGRPMKEYVVVPPALLKSPAELRTWLARSAAYAALMPAKEPKVTKSEKGTKSEKETRSKQKPVEKPGGSSAAASLKPKQSRRRK